MGGITKRSLNAEQVKMDLCVAFEVEGNRALDDGGTEAAARWRLYRRAAAFLPIGSQDPTDASIFQMISTRPDEVSQRAILGRVGHHLVDDQRQRRERLGIQSDLRPLHFDAVGARAEISGPLRTPPATASATGAQLRLVIWSWARGQSLNAAAEHAGKFLNAEGRVLALRDQPAHKAQNVADAMIKSAIINSCRSCALRRSRAARSESCRITSSSVTRRLSAIWRSADVLRFGLATHDVLPELKAFARC